MSVPHGNINPVGKCSKQRMIRLSQGTWEKLVKVKRPNAGSFSPVFTAQKNRGLLRSQPGVKLIGTGYSRNPYQGFSVSLNADGNTRHPYFL